MITFLLSNGLLDVQSHRDANAPAIYRTSPEGAKFLDYLRLKYKQSPLRRFGRRQPPSKEQQLVDLLKVGLSKHYGFSVQDGQVLVLKLDQWR